MLFVGTQISFDKGSELLEMLAHQEVSAKQIERSCHQYGEMLEQEPAQELEPTPSAEVAYGMVDGSFIQIRQKGWKEVKLGRFFNSKPENSQEKKTKKKDNSRYLAHYGQVEGFREKGEAICRVDQKRVWIADGAPWIWKWLDEKYPEHPQILDYYHACEKLRGFAYQAISGEVNRRRWLQIQEKHLYEGQIDSLIQGLRHLLVKSSLLHDRQKLINYYTENAHRMRYQEYRNRGWLIGSGPIESAHRTIVQQRLKCSGMRWTDRGAQQMLNLRVAEKSQQWYLVRKLLVA